MSLGVLNNLSAMYAANNLSNTQTSLSKTLQQLSSGSRINSGADDAAGLSLVNGLQANSQALLQSQTNATEGVGLLQVADGALSQVTNLLNRAVTLATEVSNGTLNVSQAAAADQEYKSILSEIDNIGQTTTYNQKAVFGTTTNIYTGDSSSSSASIDSLSISSLSRGNVGDGSGTIGYTNGKSVFLDLSNNGATANVGDSLKAAATTTIDVAYLDAAGVSQTTTISAGAGTAYTNTVQGLITAINNSGLNISASFGSSKDAGVAGGTVTDKGIIINGNVGITNNPTSGTFAVGITEDAVAANAVGDLQSNSTALVGAYGAGTVGTAQISYSATAGTSLTGSTLSGPGGAQSALTSLNAAIAAVAGQDGYIGSQINTLNAVGQVLSTQQQNIVAAQNAVQATDYATASSNMSKYQILSQTGIAALAQANSMSQMVTKLLQ